MNVTNVMCDEPRAVRMTDRLDAAARILWEVDCGFVPVVDGADLLVGVVTDRDLCMAAYTQGKTLSDVPVLAVMGRDIATCRADDKLAVAMDVMSARQVHRLPVVDARGVLVGVLSTNDLIQAAAARPAAVDLKKVFETLAAIGAPRAGARDFGSRDAAPAKGPAEEAAQSAEAAVDKPAPQRTRKKAAKKAPAKATASKPRTTRARASKAGGARKKA